MCNQIKLISNVSVCFLRIRWKAFICTHLSVCLHAHGHISVCMLCVCILILTWKGTSTLMYYLLKIKSWRQTSVISVGQLTLPLPSQNALNMVQVLRRIKERRELFLSKQASHNYVTLQLLSPTLKCIKLCKCTIWKLLAFPSSNWFQLIKQDFCVNTFCAPFVVKQHICITSVAMVSRCVIHNCWYAFFFFISHFCAHSHWFTHKRWISYYVFEV